ncbi:MAG: ATP-binding protein [Pseudolysinimonas sp.]
MPARLRIVVVGDSAFVADVVVPELVAHDRDHEVVGTIGEAVVRAAERPVDLVITGLTTSVAEDLDALRRIRRTRPDAKLLVLSPTGTSQDVIDAIRGHAFAVCQIPCSAPELASLIELALDTPHWSDGIELLSASPVWIEVRASCQMVTADRLVHFMDALGCDLAPDTRTAISTAFRELLLNAIEHGGQFDPSRHVTITCVRTDGAIIYLIRDPGHGFSLSSLPHAALSNPEGEPAKHMEHRERLNLRPGGFGLLLARGLVDHIVHNEHGNAVMLVKYLDQSGEHPQASAPPQEVEPVPRPVRPA